MSDTECYSRLIDWLNKSWWKLPQSDHLYPSIVAFLTPEEADLLTGIPFLPRTIEDLAEMKGMEIHELATRLDDLARRGVLWRRPKGKSVLYSLNDAFSLFFRGPFYADEPHKATRALAQPLNRYVSDGLMHQLSLSHTKPLRAIPIHKTVQDPRKILPYEDVIDFVDSRDYFTVSPCACRQRKSLDPNSAHCAHPKEVCLHFGALGHYLADNGLAREIPKEEAKEILQQAADSGLVHAMSNWEKDPDTLCNCCRCSCLFFEAYHLLGHDRSHDFSNYRVKANPETCKACGLCVERCPVGALGIDKSSRAWNKKGNVVVLHPDRCLGCGVCVHKCSTQSLVLERRKEFSQPPESMGEWMKRWTQDQRAVVAS